MLPATNKDDENISEEQIDLHCFLETKIKNIAQVYMAESQ